MSKLVDYYKDKPSTSLKCMAIGAVSAPLAIKVLNNVDTIAISKLSSLDPLSIATISIGSVLIITEIIGIKIKKARGE
ncbi:hypothetical protein U729_3244 (plasmid) [Clostridium baratii str. Sullivan]|uniref:Uncharacterized protein n=1 Tax=Clostridium baratii str. Sullivan TaxID=1415775 RepID=A0A0A7G0B8_9CLOT|nr:hypothetical protein [Clostridium baratii]AIY85294.1 hypothetical protein U729_3244 [Clostridium baratii str. Sullivan]